MRLQTIAIVSLAVALASGPIAIAPFVVALALVPEAIDSLPEAIAPVPVASELLMKHWLLCRAGCWFPRLGVARRH